MSESKQLRALFDETKRELAALKPWQRTNRVPLNETGAPKMTTPSEAAVKLSQAIKKANGICGMGIDEIALHFEAAIDAATREEIKRSETIRHNALTTIEKLEAEVERLRRENAALEAQAGKMKQWIRDERFHRDMVYELPKSRQADAMTQIDNWITSRFLTPAPRDAMHSPEEASERFNELAGQTKMPRDEKKYVIHCEHGGNSSNQSWVVLLNDVVVATFWTHDEAKAWCDEQESPPRDEGKEARFLCDKCAESLPLTAVKHADGKRICLHCFINTYEKR